MARQGKDSGTSSVDFTSEEFLAGQFASATVQGDITRLKELAKLVIASPLGELDLGDKCGLDPRTAFKNCRSDALSPAFLWQVHERTSLAFSRKPNQLHGNQDRVAKCETLSNRHGRFARC
jgi:hypothetical protein